MSNTNPPIGHNNSYCLPSGCGDQICVQYFVAIRAKNEIVNGDHNSVGVKPYCKIKRDTKKRLFWFNNHLWGPAFNLRYIFFRSCGSSIYCCYCYFVCVLQPRKNCCGCWIFLWLLFFPSLRVSLCTRCSWLVVRLQQRTDDLCIAVSIHTHCSFDFILTFNLLKILA